jgi:hypothetical protein
MTYVNQITVCPDNVRHHFRDMRAKSKAAGPPWHFFSRCIRCTAILHQIVSQKIDKQGNITPVSTAFIITSSKPTQIQSRVERASPEAVAAATAPDETGTIRPDADDGEDVDEPAGGAES